MKAAALTATADRHPVEEVSVGLVARMVVTMDLDAVTPTEVPQDAHLLDVREQNEWDAGHAPNAHHLPASTLLENLDQLPEDGEVYVVCRSGGRSRQVTQWLNLNGFEAIDVRGGMDQWLESGLPIVTDGPGEPRII